ncbi:MAG TPA: hypothetical protein VGB17_01010 [Pyrinomonadaceae bacterium]|jgi:hypothetical protein
METTAPEKQDDSVQAAPELPEWSDSETRWLEYEKFIAEVSKLRARPETPKPLWQKILETSGGAALITVLIGGILGQLINLSIQSSLKDREHRQSMLKARNDQALAAYNKFLEQGSETVKHAYGLIGNCLSASDDLISITKPEFNMTDLAQEQLKVQTAQKTDVRKKYNETFIKWREEREQLGLLMKYYHHNEAAVTSAWLRVQESTTNYMNCASDRHQQRFDSNVPEDKLPSCEDKKNAIRSALDELTKHRLEVESKYQLKIIDEPNSQ